MLAELAKARQDLVVNQVNIDRAGSTHIDWQSPLAQQHKVQFTPYFKIYDPNGKLIVEGKDASPKVFEMAEAVKPKSPNLSPGGNGKVNNAGKGGKTGKVLALDSSGRNRQINKGAEGELINIEQHLVKGKTNIVEFYSDY